MLVAADLDRFVVFNNRDEDEEVVMVKEECDSIGDVEEGEISDTDSVKEISEKDFVKQQDLAATTTKNSGGNSNNSTNKPRVWTMQELCSSYAMSPNYSAGLVNFAWARAVQNKPLADKKSDEGNRLSSSVSGKEDNTVVIDVDDEKEEGELEEGEIDLDGDVEESEGLNPNEMNVKKENGFQRRVNSIRNELETVTMIEADKSFELVCSRLQKSLDSLQEVISEKCGSVDDLVQLSFAAIQTLNSVLSSMDQNRREQNKEFLLRLLTLLTKQAPSVFLPGQIREIEFMMRSLEYVTPPRMNQNDSDATKNDQTMRVTESFESVSNNDSNSFLEQLKSARGSYKGRGMLLPLLDLHKDHDEDSLPSPTGAAAPLLMPVTEALPIGGGPVKPEWPVRRPTVENQHPTMHPYETDAVRAVSTYQQKFGVRSFVMNDLPSPTPSEEGNVGEGDTGGEVCSSSIAGRVTNVNLPIVAQSVVSSGSPTDMSSSQGLNYFKSSGHVALGPNTAPKSSTRSRDPRLRFANPDIGSPGITQRPSINKNDHNVDGIGDLVSSRKQKIVEETSSDGPALKRPRNALADSEVSRDVQSVPKSGGWLEDKGGAGNHFGVSRSQMVDNIAIEPPKYTSSVSSMAMPNVTSVNDHLSRTGASNTSLQSLLKNIAVNPAMLVNLLKMEHQNSANPPTSSPHMTNRSPVLGAFPPVNFSLLKPLVSAPAVAGMLQTPQTTSMDEDGKVRMKPRDPRRVLHNNTSQKGGNLVLDQMKTTAAMMSTSQEMKGNPTYKKQEDQTDRMSIASQSITPPDITRQFTKNLRNIADIMSGTQASMSPAVVTHIPSSQPSLDGADVKGVTPELSISSSGTTSSTEEVAVATSQPQKTWGDVEHLFEGFDDQQKAAIHKERSRRMEEQRKMFDARKLCLVLDLDHTLLNSAKFSEVDPVHEDILRKKEEQDREKPYRHLFRFPHMGMWTKLRPGVWNFLEKASKLFEMHLYTMGNKLYATEMAKLLDPKGVLFNGRVISRGDDNDLIDGDDRVPKIKDLDGVLGMESDVVIIDDSVRVWPHNKLNLIAVERYIYFPCSRRQFGLLGPSLLEIDHDERPEDGTLASSLGVRFVLR